VCAQTWQGQALDALAAWLAEDGARVEPRLASREACQRFVALFAAYAPAGDSEALSRLLDAFLRILRRSSRITVRAPATPSLPFSNSFMCPVSATPLQVVQRHFLSALKNDRQWVGANDRICTPI
jgi:hypothetical protein